MTKFVKPCSTYGCSFIALHKDKCEYKDKCEWCNGNILHQLATESWEVVARLKATNEKRRALIRRLEELLYQTEQETHDPRRN